MIYYRYDGKNHAFKFQVILIARCLLIIFRFRRIRYIILQTDRYAVRKVTRVRIHVLFVPTLRTRVRAETVVRLLSTVSHRLRFYHKRNGLQIIVAIVITLISCKRVATDEVLVRLCELDALLSMFMIGARVMGFTVNTTKLIATTRPTHFDRW